MSAFNQKDNKSIDVKFIFNFMPALSELPTKVFDNLNVKIQQSISDNEDIAGVFLLSSDDRQPLIYSRTLENFEEIKNIAELVNTFNIRYLVKSLNQKGYHGIEIFNFNEFTVGFVKLTDTDVFAVLLTHQPKIESITEKIVKDMRDDVFNEEMNQKLRKLPDPKVKTDNPVSNAIPKPDK